MSLVLEDLAYQTRAVEAAVHVLDGQVRNTFERANLFGIHANIVDLLPFQLAENKRRVLLNNGIPEAAARLDASTDFCVEMETGTGKTLVYQRTIYELYKAYGLTKFIILTPSVPVREGVLASFRDFAQPLQDRYGYELKPFEYHSKKLNKLRRFIEDPRPQVMVMTIQSFNTDDNIINRTGRDDSYDGMTFLQALGKTRPVLIMDEPQEGMDTDNAKARIATLNPSATFRYSATHKVLKNLIYRLTPAQAYRENLVKKVEVLSVLERNDEATLKLELAEIQTRTGAPPKAKVHAWCNTAAGIKWKASKWLKDDADLEDATKNVSYRGFKVERIYKHLDGKFRVKFTNGVELIEKERAGDRAGLFRLQLHYLIQRHFEKRAKLRPMGIKPLSLVFIDKVANYLGDDGEHPPIIRDLFVDEYTKVLAAQTHGGEIPGVEEVQGYYFATTKAGEYTDSTASMLKNQEMFDQILRDKEALLDLGNPIEFIFTHSALGVGWDNPNVFNIATLNTAYDENRKRQELGRGLRICRKHGGGRVYDTPETPEGEEINLLTVVPNESYETFAQQYQQQIIDDFGSKDAGANLRNRPRNQPRRNRITRKEEAFASEAFRAFWDKLARKTDYTVAFQEDQLISRAVEGLNAISFATYQAQATSTRLRVGEDDTVTGDDHGSAFHDLQSTFAPLDLVEELSEASGLAYPTVFDIIQRCDNHAAIVANPARFLAEATVVLKNVEMEELFRGLSYHPTGDSIPLSELKATIERSYPVVKTPNRGVYDGVFRESGPEENFAKNADADNEVVCFLKLPEGYKIKVPFGGTYNPDFGIVVKRTQLADGNSQQYYFVVETKSTNDLDDRTALTEEERLKIRCAMRHFEALGIEAQFGYPPYAAPIADYAKFKDEVPS